MRRREGGGKTTMKPRRQLSEATDPAMLQNQSAPHESRLWFCSVSLEGNVPVVTYDQSKNAVSGWVLSSVGEQPGIVEPVLYNAKTASARTIMSYKMLATGTGDILARGEGLYLFNQLPEKEVSLYQAKIICRDGEVDDFFAVRPYLLRMCTDLARSNIKWTRQDEFYVGWNKIKFIPGCMNGAHIAREKLSKMVIVSNAFKAAAEKIEPKGIGFSDPERPWGF